MMRGRRKGWQLAMVILWAGCVFPAGRSGLASERPNILLIMSDDQGYWDTSVAGNADIDTPQMERLARQGITFRRFYASMVCAPTRAGLMTGRYYLRTGLYNTRFGGDTMGIEEVTLADLLRRAGYRTGLFGKWHLGKYFGYQPHQRGFATFFGHYHGHIERYDYPDQLVSNGAAVTARGYVTELFTDAAIDFMQANREQPFFCFVSYNAPHSPFVVGASHDGMPAADELIQKYLDRKVPLRDARIYAMVEIIDRNLGRLLEALDELQIADNTMVIYTSDNGGVSRHFRAGLRGGKGSAWEGGVRVPMFVRWPGTIEAGRTTDEMASHIDWLPTLCRIAGIDPPGDRAIDGRDIGPLLRSSDAPSPHRYVYHTWDRYTPNPFHRWSIGDRRFKLVGHDPSGQKSRREPVGELFDLVEDPGERRNIAAEHPGVVRRLRSEFLRWFEEVTHQQTYRPIAIPIGHPEENPVELQASWSQWRGPNIQYTFRGYDWDTIDSWKEPGEAAVWRLDVKKSGRYRVWLAYGCHSLDAGGTLEIRCGDRRLRHLCRATGGGEVFVRRAVGVLELPAGAAELTARVARCPGAELMRLNRVWLERLSSADPQSSTPPGRGAGGM